MWTILAVNSFIKFVLPIVPHANRKCLFCLRLKEGKIKKKKKEYNVSLFKVFLNISNLLI